MYVYVYICIWRKICEKKIVSIRVLNKKCLNSEKQGSVKTKKELNSESIWWMLLTVSWEFHRNKGKFIHCVYFGKSYYSYKFGKRPWNLACL